jgi:hypothetical protein
VELASHNGFLWIVPGHALQEDGTLGDEQNLLYVLVVCPDLAATARGTETRHAPRVNTYVARWDTSRGPVTVAVDWDKRADKVTIGSKTFLRPAGNVFVVQRDRSGSLHTEQLSSVGSDANADEALRFIQRQMSHDSLIASIRLPQRE